MRRTRGTLVWGLAVGAVTLLAACGGGDADGPFRAPRPDVVPTPTPEINLLDKITIVSTRWMTTPTGFTVVTAEIANDNPVSVAVLLQFRARSPQGELLAASAEIFFPTDRAIRPGETFVLNEGAFNQNFPRGTRFSLALLAAERR